MPFRGVLFLLGAGFLFSVMSVLVKLLNGTLSSGQIALGRAVFSMVLCLIAIKQQQISPWGNNRKILFLRGTFGAIGVLCMYFALSMMPLAEVITIHYLNPILTALLAALFLKEKLSLKLFLALGTGLMGVVVLTQPQSIFEGDVRLPLLGVALSLGVAFASACAYTCVRHLRLTEKPIVIVFYFSLISLPASLPFAIYDWRPLPAKAWLMLVAIGIVTQLAQVLLTHGLGKVEAGKATGIGYVQILFAALFGFVIFDEVPDRFTLIGGSLVIAGFFVLLSHKRSLASSTS